MKRGDPLSPNELKAVEMLARGKSHTQISMEMALSPSTTRVHVFRAKKKLGAQTTAALIAKATAIGIERLKRGYGSEDDDNS